jgi:hypothetical protein
MIILLILMLLFILLSRAVRMDSALVRCRLPAVRVR